MTLNDAVVDRIPGKCPSPPSPTSRSAELQRAVAELGYTDPTPIQAEAIAPLVEGRDLIGQAATGTGKTAAFALPMLERLGEQRPVRTGRTAPFGLVLAPTRELGAAGHRGDHQYGRAWARASSPSTAARPSARSARRCEGVTSSWPPRAGRSTS